MNTNTDQTPTARQITPVTDEQFEASCIIISRWMMEHPEMHNLVLEKRIASGAKKAVEFATKVSDNPVEAPAAQENCPTCGSDKRSHRSTLQVDVGMPCDNDEWHNPQPPQEPCPSCGGDGIETCHNPDHGLIDAIGSETRRLGCPGCGHDPKHKMSGPCPECGGTGIVSKPPQEKWEPKVGDTVTGNWDVSSPKTIYEVIGFTPSGLVNLTKWPHHSVDSVACERSSLTLEQKGGALPKWSLPTPPAGQQWHRVDWWREEWLKDGYRPLLHGEPCQADDEVLVNGKWTVGTGDVGFPMGIMHNHTRTKRPAPTQPATAKTAGEAAYQVWHPTERIASAWSHAGAEIQARFERVAQAAIAFASSAETQMPSGWQDIIAVEIPNEFHEFARQGVIIDTEMQKRGMDEWQLGAIAARRLVSRLQSRAESSEAKVKQLEAKHEAACTTISQMQNERAHRDSFIALSNLSSWLGVGGGDGTVSAEDYEKRIREGVDAMLKIETQRREKAEQTVDALRREVETITADRDTLESYYQKVTKVALDCNPIPASQRPDNQIEPPWEVFARVKSERDAAKGALEFAMQKMDEFRQWLTDKR